MKVRGKFWSTLTAATRLWHSRWSAWRSMRRKWGQASSRFCLRASEMNALRSQQLQQILRSHPGDDAVVLFIRQADGRKFRAELPIKVDLTKNIIDSELLDLFGRKVWGSSAA